MYLKFELDLIKAFLQALDPECMKKNEILNFVYVVPETLYDHFKEQKIVLGAGKNGTTVKSGNQTKLEANLAQ